jgi:hypothetical protein
MTGISVQDHPASVYLASDIKRFRRTKAAITTIKDVIIDILSNDHPADGEAGVLCLDRSRRNQKGRD